MSIESAKACMERIKADEDFAKKVMECKDAEARMAFVRAAGYDFTTEEVSPLVGEIQDDELEFVAGGHDKWACHSNVEM
jgi:predicted ribosomally synthesized peptide with nif11-like leader